MVKPHPFPSYQPSLSLPLSYIPSANPSSFHCNSRSTYGMKLKLAPELALDKRSPLMTSSNFSRDPCKLDRPECNFANVNKM